MLWDSPGALPAGRVCGSGSHCQHRCCHYPRRLSFVEVEVVTHGHARSCTAFD